MANKVLIKVDKNGTEHWADYTCDRCGGAGHSEAWKFTGYTCYKCGGSGILTNPRIEKVYTPEYEEKLAERRLARQKKVKSKKALEALANLDKAFEKEGFKNGKTYVVIGSTYDIKDDIKAKGGKFNYNLGWHFAEKVEGFDTVELTVEECFEEVTLEHHWLTYKGDLKAVIESKLPKTEITSEYVGNIGERLTLAVKLVKIASYETVDRYSWRHETVTNYIYTFEDAEGNQFIWMTGTGLHIEKDTEVTLKGTIKDHKEYKGVKQTVLSRCKIN